MKALDFRTWLAQLTTLNRGQKDRLRRELDRRANAEEVIRLVEQGLQEKPLCPPAAIRNCSAGVPVAACNATVAANAGTPSMH